MSPSRGCGVIAIGFAALWLVCSVIGANQAQPFWRYLYRNPALALVPLAILTMFHG